MSEWVTIRGGQKAHKSCLDNYNAAMSCGQDSGDCGDHRCAFSAAEAPPSAAEALRMAFADDTRAWAQAYVCNCGGLEKAAWNHLAIYPGLERSGVTHEMVVEKIQRLLDS